VTDSPAAVFLDRDGTIIADTHYIARADQVSLLPGAADGISRLNRAGWRVILVTNQSGIGRGLLTEAQFHEVQQAMQDRLAASGATIDATYWCPHDPDREACDCRKPATALYRRAIAEHAIDGARSWFVGDRLRDVLPARAFRGRGILVVASTTPEEDVERARSDFLLAPTLSAAIEQILTAR